MGPRLRGDDAKAVKSSDGWYYTFGAIGILKLPMSLRGQERGCPGPFGEDRIAIPKLPWRTFHRNETGTPGVAPNRPLCCGRRI
jgi:hypothetical protein